MHIGLLGFGVVGAGVYDWTRGRADLTVDRVLVRSSKPGIETISTHSIEDILNDPAIDTVVEVMGGLHPAYEYICAVIEAGKHVVTANKAVVAAYYPQLTALARQHGVALRCTAAVGGGIPWLVNLERCKRLDRVVSVGGIMNGTSNFIMDAMHASPVSFPDILKKAQDLGYAEADPSADIDGIDTANKAVISSSLAFETYCRRDFPMSGIRNLKKSDLDWFRERGQSIRLMMLSTAQDDRYCCVVEPMALSVHSLEANVPDNFNLTTLIGDTIGELKFYGQGAGSLPTGNAIVSDLIAICRQEPFDVPAMSEKQFDPSLLRGDYILRANGEIGEFHDMDPVQMHEQYRLTLQEDPDAFLVRLL